MLDKIEQDINLICQSSWHLPKRLNLLIAEYVLKKQKEVLDIIAEEEGWEESKDFYYNKIFEGK